jgi:hypothetical protein
MVFKREEQQPAKEQQQQPGPLTTFEKSHIESLNNMIIQCDADISVCKAHIDEDTRTIANTEAKKTDIQNFIKKMQGVK